MDYEFTLVFDLDIHHFASCSKDRTGIFMDKELFIISENTGKQIADWCTMGVSVETVKSLIQQAPDLQQLTEIYKIIQLFQCIGGGFFCKKPKSCQLY